MIFRISVVAAVTICLLCSCSQTKKIAYMDHIKDTVIEDITHDLEPVIQKNDLLSISVGSVNQEATQIFNVSNNNAVTGTNSSSANSGYMNQVFGYLVDQKGYVKFPMLGNVYAEGLTKKMLADNITRMLVSERLLLEPIVNIRYLNYKVTVLGEVGKPMVINVPNEKINILEALGLAGDITVYGKKDNVLLIREEASKKIVKRINISSPSLLTSPYYYLQSNDIIYVEPNKAKVSSSSNVKQWLPMVISGLTLVVLALDHLDNK